MNRLDDAVAGGWPPWHAAVAEPEPLPPAQQPLHARDENRQLERLRQIVVRARLESLEHVVGAATGGEHQDRHELSGAPQTGHHAEAIDARQHHVEDHEVEAGGIGGKLGQRRLPGIDDLDVVLLGDQVEAEPLGDVLLVFDDENTAHCGGNTGSCTVNVLPRPGPSLSANTLPPWRAITDRAMNSPRPVPFTRVATAPGIR